MNKISPRRSHLSALITFAALLSSCAWSWAISPDTEALLQLLVKKNIVSEKEASSLRSDLASVPSASAKSPEKKSSTAANVLSTPFSTIKLGGDLRLRYQYDNRDVQVNPPDNGPNDNQRSRWRFRLRLNADIDLPNHFFAGVQIATGQASDSDNQTFENGYTDYNIFLNRAYLGWAPADWITVTGGKVPNPFFNTEQLVWDADINPTGLTQTIHFHKLFPLASSDLYPGDKGAAPSLERPWELSLILGEFIYDDNFEGNFDSDASTDAYQFVAQLVGAYKFSNGVKVTLGPGYQTFNASDLSGFINENTFSDVGGVSGETRDLSIVTFPGQVDFKIGKLPAKFYWDFAYNFLGRERAENIYSLYEFDDRGNEHSLYRDEDSFAYLVGAQIGNTKKAGDWSFNVNWRQTGIAAVDPNLNDSDFAFAELNTRGIKSSFSYQLQDFLTLSLSYMYAWNLRDNLTGGQATGGAAISDANAIQIFQVDLNAKF